MDGCRTDINRGTTNDISSTTATKYLTYLSNIIIWIVCLCLRGTIDDAVQHINPNVGVTNYFSRFTLTATINLANGGTREYIHAHSISSFQFTFSARIRCTILGQAVDRVRRIVASTIKLTNDKGLTSVLIYVYGDGAIDVATSIIATEHSSKPTARHRQFDTTIDISILCTAKHLSHKIFRHTLQNNFCITFHFCLTTSAVDVISFQLGTTIRCGCASKFSCII